MIEYDKINSDEVINTKYLIMFYFLLQKKVKNLFIKEWLLLIINKQKNKETIKRLSDKKINNK
jgi:hypothetical protein